MNLRNKLAIFCATLAMVLVATQTRAVTQVFSPASLNSPQSLEDFEDDTFASGVTFSATSGTHRASSPLYNDNGTPSGTWGLSTFNVPDPIAMDFSPNVYSVGMYFGNDEVCCTAFAASLDVYQGATLVDTISVNANLNDGADQFLGFNSAAPISKVVIRYGNGSNVNLYTYIDDVRFSTVPEPTALALMSIAAAGSLFFPRRSRMCNWISRDACD